MYFLYEFVVESSYLLLQRKQGNGFDEDVVWLMCIIKMLKIDLLSNVVFLAYPGYEEK